MFLFLVFCLICLSTASHVDLTTSPYSTPYYETPETTTNPLTCKWENHVYTQNIMAGVEYYIVELVKKAQIKSAQFLAAQQAFKKFVNDNFDPDFEFEFIDYSNTLNNIPAIVTQTKVTFIAALEQFITAVNTQIQYSPELPPNVLLLLPKNGFFFFCDGSKLSGVGYRLVNTALITTKVVFKAIGTQLYITAIKIVKSNADKEFYKIQQLEQGLPAAAEQQQSPPEFPSFYDTESIKKNTEKNTEPLITPIYSMIIGMIFGASIMFNIMILFRYIYNKPAKSHGFRTIDPY